MAEDEFNKTEIPVNNVKAPASLGISEPAKA
jgi:hypothetical protein